MKYHQTLEDIYQKVVKGELPKQEAVEKLKHLIIRNVSELGGLAERIAKNRDDREEVNNLFYDPNLRTKIGYISLRKEIIHMAEKSSIVTELAANYTSEGMVEDEAKILAKLELILATRMPFEKWPPEEFGIEKSCRNYALDGYGHIFKLGIYNHEDYDLGFFPKEICHLERLQELNIKDDCIYEIPDCIKELKNLKYLRFMYTRLEKIPIALKQLENLECLDLMSESQLDSPYPFHYYHNVLDYINLEDYNEDISVKEIHAIMEKKIQSFEQQRKNVKNNQESILFNFPANFPENNYELKILWLLDNKGSCTWADFIREIKLSQSTLARNLNYLLEEMYIKKETGKKHYQITNLGKLRLTEMQNKLT